MNRKLKVLNVGLAAALLSSLVASAADTNGAAAKPAGKPADKIAELFGDSVVAKGTGVEVKRSELDAAVMGLKASSVARGQQLTPDQSALLERQVLDRLIQIQLLMSRATEADKAKGKEESDKRYNVILKRAGSEEALARQLKSVGMSVEELRRKMTEESIAEAVVIRELKVDITDADAKKFYDENPARFEQPERVRVRHVLLGTLDPSTRAPVTEDKRAAKRKTAEEVLKKARAGDDFATLVKDYSDDTASKDNGGEYTFARGQMVPEFEQAAFALKPNEVSDIVTSQYGFHVIKSTEKIPAKKLTLDDVVEGTKVGDAVKDSLRRQQLEKLLPDYIEKLTKEAKVEVLDSKLKQTGELMKEMTKTPSGVDAITTDKK